MIDTVKLFIPRHSDPTALSHLTRIAGLVDGETGEVWKQWGPLKNLRVSLQTNGQWAGLTITGSLSRFLSGTNFTTLSPSSTREALDEMSALLHVRLDDARVYRLDYGLNLDLNIPAPAVTQSLGPAPPRWRKVTQDIGSVAYASKEVEIALYDKVREAKEKDAYVPNGSLHVLRAEIRLRKGVKKRTGPISAGDLAATALHRRMLRDWEQRMDSVRFTRRPEFQFGNTLGETIRALAAVGSASLTAERLLNQLYDERRRGLWDSSSRRRQATSIARYVRDLSQDPNLSVPSLVEESFRRAVRYGVERQREVLNQV